MFQELTMTGGPVILIHGGCGVIPRKRMTAEYEQECRDVLKKSLIAGYDILKAGGSALDAVMAAVVVMEDHPNFNAGKGAVFTTQGTNELDAGLMDGSTGAAGGCSTLTKVKNPIRLARSIMDKTPHTVLGGPGAEAFAMKQGLEMVDPAYYFTQRRFDQLQKILASTPPAEGGGLRKVTPTPAPQLDHSVDVDPKEEKSSDTVGAVALDLQGRLASASSTGGLTGKLPGRLSDSSIPGAGFWADSRVAVSMTGHGDFFLRRSVSHEMASIMKYRQDVTLEEAAKKVIFETLEDCHAGLIAVDAGGRFCMPYNSDGMFRGYVDSKGVIDVRIWEY